MPKSKTTISQAAIKRDNVIWTLPRPARHHNILWAMYDVDNGKSPDERPIIIPAHGEQGFITNDGAFVSRECAFNIATCAGQFIGKPCAQPKLYSEDLW